MKLANPVITSALQYTRSQLLMRLPSSAVALLPSAWSESTKQTPNIMQVMLLRQVHLQGSSLGQKLSKQYTASCTAGHAEVMLCLAKHHELQQEGGQCCAVSSLTQSRAI